MQPGTRLTLLSAGAGTGKTTLLAEWLRTLEHPVAWLSLDSADNDAARFWRHLAAAIETAGEPAGSRMLALLEASDSDSVSPTFDDLLSNLAVSRTPENRLVVVLDDYHVIRAEEIHDSLGRLLDREMPGLHLMIASRHDPPLPLSRLRGRGQLSEIRANDLKFSRLEVGAFLQSANASLEPQDLDTLASRTEGWAAGLRLAALSLAGRHDTAAFVREFAGSHRFVFDYLLDEVLALQSPDTRDFLLRTAILDRLTSELCDAVLQRSGSAEVLDQLERSNLFLVPLDSSREWFRYHQLFREVLRVRAAQELAAELPALHQRAAAWHLEHADFEAAVAHAQACSDPALLAEAVEAAWQEMDRDRRSRQWLEWALLVPAEIAEGRPALAAGIAWAYLTAGNLEAAEHWLEHSSQGDTGAGHPSSHPGPRYLRSSLASARAYMALSNGDTVACAEHARFALDHLPPSEPSLRARPLSLLAIAHWATGELDEAAAILTSEINRATRDGDISFLLPGTYALAELERSRGRLEAAERACTAAIQFCPEGSACELRTADLQTLLADIALARNDLDESENRLARSKELGDQFPLPHWRYRWLVVSSLLASAQGRHDEALSRAEEAERLYVRGPVPDVRPIAAVRARIALRAGHTDEAMRLAASLTAVEPGLDTYLTEYSHLTRARIVLENQDLPAAEGLAREVEQSAMSNGRPGPLAEALLLRAVAAARGGAPTASERLERAAVTASPHRFLAPFAEFWPALATTVAAALREPRAFPATRELQADLGPPRAPGGGPGTSAALHEPLTAREREILAMLADGHRNQDIADELVISLATVKRHVANLYGKLGVTHRTEAVALANRLGLL